MRPGRGRPTLGARNGFAPPASICASRAEAAGRPLLLLTGIGANLDMWRPFERLLRGREVIAVDAPGTGLSERPRYPLRMRGLARVVARPPR